MAPSFVNSSLLFFTERYLANQECRGLGARPPKARGIVLKNINIMSGRGLGVQPPEICTFSLGKRQSLWLIIKFDFFLNILLDLYDLYSLHSTP